jgi:hypothetical protein
MLVGGGSPAGAGRPGGSTDRSPAPAGRTFTRPAPQRPAPVAESSAKPAQPPAKPAERSQKPSEPPKLSAQGDLKGALLSNIRESNKVFFSMVIAQAQSVDVVGDRIEFAFAPVHKSLRSQFDSKKGWLENMAQQIAGRPIAIASKDGDPAVAAAKAEEAANAATRQADLKAKAKSEPSVQNILDVFGGDIESVEES